MSGAAKVYQLSQSKGDIKNEIQKAVGDLDGISLFSGRVLIAIYIEPEKTAGGIILPNSAVKENIYQGVVGLVLKKGNLAFVSDDRNDFHGQDVQVGEWVTFRPGDAKRIQIRV